MRQGLAIRKRPCILIGSMQKTKSNLFKIIKASTGLGLATKIPINKGEVVIEYVGNIITAKEADERPNRYLFEINSRWTIDGAVRSNLARYINHTCKKANCEAEQRGKQIFITAARNIAAGEELRYDYGKEHFDEYIKPIGCKCDWCLAKPKTVKKVSKKKIKKHVSKKKSKK